MSRFLVTFDLSRSRLSLPPGGRLGELAPMSGARLAKPEPRCRTCGGGLRSVRNVPPQRDERKFDSPLNFKLNVLSFPRRRQLRKVPPVSLIRGGFISDCHLRRRRSSRSFFPSTQQNAARFHLLSSAVSQVLDRQTTSCVPVQNFSS